MKKIMILMLSLAVLFSFAACDNSSNTPSDTDETSGVITDGMYEVLGTQVYKLITDSSNGVIAKLGTNSIEIVVEGTVTTDYTAASPYTSISYTYKTPGSTALAPEGEVTITVSGRQNDAKGIAATADHSVILDSYTVTFSAYANNDVTESVNVGDYVLFEGSFSGSLVGNVTIKPVATDTTKATVTSSITSVILPESITASYDGNDAVSETLVECISFNDTDSDNYYTAEAYRTAKEEAEYDGIMAFVKVLVNASASPEFGDQLQAFLSAGESTFSAEGKGSATFTYTPSSTTTNATLATVSGQSIRIKEGTAFSISFAGDTQLSVGATKFTAKEYTLSGTFVVTGAASGKFTEITIADLKGALTAGTINGNGAEIASYGATAGTSDLAFGNPTEGTVTAKAVTTPIGPDLVQNTETGIYSLAQIGDVTVDVSDYSNWS